MASSNKAQDPAAAALLAIEEALNLGAAGQGGGPAEANPIGATSADKAKERVFGEREAATPRPSPSRPPRDAAGTLEPRPAAIDEDRLFGPARANSAASGAETQATERSGEAAPSMQPANDDRQSAGEILRAFQSRSSRVPAVFVAACSGLWVLLTLGYFIANRAVLFNLPGESLLPQATLYLMTIVGPIIFFLVTAALLRRGQEMRLAARSMTEVAVRLAEPETIAAGQMITLSQAIRREVASMGDGIERALARASELETLVRSEVSNLERSYSDNERRVHSLVDELASERESILTNADRVRGAIALAHDSLSRDLAGASSRFAESVGEAAGRVTASLNSKGEEIKTALGRGRDDLVDQLSSHGNDLIKRLTQTGEEATASLAGASDGIARTLADRFAEMDDKFKTARETLAADLEIRGDALAQRVDATGTRIADTIFSRGENLAVRLAET
ncbi:MAG TPA: apolipoprotein acyltransferase, partial [Methylocella sp.]|nr:apolipoprotein acyltransferase [Methylocella sp.]